MKHIITLLVFGAAFVIPWLWVVFLLVWLFQKDSIEEIYSDENVPL